MTTTNIVQMRAQLEIKDAFTIATPAVFTTYQEAVALQQQIKVLEKCLTTLKDALKIEMKGCEAMFSDDGREIITWKTNKPTIKLDTEHLRIMYPKIYEICLITIPGNKNFVLK